LGNPFRFPNCSHIYESGRRSAYLIKRSGTTNNGYLLATVYAIADPTPLVIRGKNTGRESGYYSSIRNLLICWSLSSLLSLCGPFIIPRTGVRISETIGDNLGAIPTVSPPLRSLAGGGEKGT
jgi:hypothetical protein